MQKFNLVSKVFYFDIFIPLILSVYVLILQLHF